jgi:hypothetical protein
MALDLLQASKVDSAAQAKSPIPILIDRLSGSPDIFDQLFVSFLHE